MNTIIPLNKRIVVEPQAKKETSKGGIIIPHNVDAKEPTKGVIIAIAPDSEAKFEIRVGDTVLIPKYAGTEIIIPATEVGEKDRQLQIIKEDDLLAVIRTG